MFYLNVCCNILYDTILIIKYNFLMYHIISSITILIHLVIWSFPSDHRWVITLSPWKPTQQPQTITHRTMHGLYSFAFTQRIFSIVNSKIVNVLRIGYFHNVLQHISEVKWNINTNHSQLQCGCPWYTKHNRRRLIPMPICGPYANIP